MNTELEFRLVQPRSTVEINLPDGRVICGTRNAEVGAFLRALPSPEADLIVGAIVNGEIHELTYPIKMDSLVQPITMRDSDGMRIYRRSLVFLLEIAFFELYPSIILTVDHSVAFGGYYCQIAGGRPMKAEELAKVEKHMRKLVKLDLPLKRLVIPLDEAIAYFKQKGEDDQVRLLSHRKKNYLTIYEVNNFRDYHHGYMVPSTGYLRWFQLSPAGEGFTLRFPRRHSPNKVEPLPEYPRLLSAFRQYGNWLERLGISSVGALNDAIQANRADEVILVSEALHEQQVSEIAAQIASRKDEIRLVLVSGPSSSGKTTFSKRLAIQLLARGIAPFPLEMDDYFVDREKTPLDDKGKPDFESIDALDRAHLTEDLSRLIAGERVQLPNFDFRLGRSTPGEEVQLHGKEIVIMEGIHGLNPALVSGLPAGQTFRVYVSALTQLNLDRHNRVSTTDTRLIRRIVRDARERGYTATQTISRWESVRNGEKRNIFPYQENSDIMFNSALAYELSTLKPLAEPLLRQVPYGTPEYVEAKRLLAFLEWFLPLGSDLVPGNSILREFLGQSILSNFTLWQTHKQ